MSCQAGTLIVGASQAGLQVAVSLRGAGDTSPITLVGDEVHAPYQRPPLSKAFLHGTTELEQLWLRTPEVLADLGVTLVTGERVEDVALTAGGPSGTAVTQRGRVLGIRSAGADRRGPTPPTRGARGRPRGSDVSAHGR